MVANKREFKLETKLLRAIRDAGLPRPVREHRFHNVRRWRFDLAYPDCKVAIEVDGGVYTRGRHTTGRGYTADQYKGNMAIEMGWLVLHYTTTMLSKRQINETVEQIRRVLLMRGCKDVPEAPEET